MILSNLLHSSRVASLLVITVILGAFVDGRGIAEIQPAEATSVSAATVHDLLREGSYAEAEMLARARLARIETEKGLESLEAAEAIDLLVESLWRYGKACEAETRDLAERAVAIKEARLGVSATPTAASLKNLGTVLASMARLRPAARAFERAIAIWEESGDAHEVELASVRRRLAIVLGNTGRYVEARTLLEQALQTQTEIVGPESLEVARTLTTIGGVMTNTGALEPARSALDRALAIRMRLLGREHPEVASTLYRLAILDHKTGNASRAEELARRALRLREAALAPGCPQIASVIGVLAAIRSDEGHLEEARGLLSRALAMRSATLGPQHPAVATSIKSLGSVLQELGDYTGARLYFERALRLEESVLGLDHPQVALSLTNLATVLKWMGDRSEARRLLERAVSIQERAFTSGHPQLATTLVNLANLLVLLGDHSSGRIRLERALEMIERTLGTDHPKVAWVLFNLARSYRETKEFDAAHSLLERARRILVERHGTQHLKVAFVLSSLALLTRDVGDPCGSIPLFDSAQAIWETRLGPSHPLVAENLLERAEARWRAGSFAEAVEDALRAEGIAREQLQSASQILSEREALRYEEVRLSGLGLALSALATRGRSGCDRTCVRRTWDALVRSRALVLDELAARHRTAHDSAAPEIVILAQNLDAARSRLARRILTSLDFEGTDVDRAGLEEARADKERAERALAARSTLFQESQAQKIIGLAEVEDSLPSDTALVAYVRYERHLLPNPEGPPESRKVPSYLALIAPGPGEDPRVVPLGPAEAIEELVRDWREEVSTPPRDQRAMSRYRLSGERLHAAIWEPIAARVREARLVLVVPDGSLNLVNLQTLPTEDGGYLVESSMLVHAVSTERYLARAAREVNADGGMLALGGPDFDALVAVGPGLASADGKPGSIQVVARTPESPDCDDVSSLLFASLPSAQAEASEVASLWSAPSARRPQGSTVVLLSGREATEDSFKARAPGQRILHVATHGFFPPPQCKSAAEDPLLRTGLALAGANRRSGMHESVEDGLLTAEEIAALDLRGVEWTVLSACGSGLGPVQAGEGVLGLRRAFEIAGVHTLIMSLWSVEDHSAREWVRRLYAHRSEGLSTAGAMRQVAVDLIDARRKAGIVTHPFYWGGFVAAGDWQ